MSVNDNETDQESTLAGLSESGVRRVLSPGSLLRQKREDLNLDIATIARDLNLDEWMLTALEADNFSKFGAQVFAKGHLKHYALYLELNPDDLLFAYYQVAERNETKPSINYPLIMNTEMSAHTFWSKWFMVFLGGLAIAALLYAVYAGGTWWLEDVQQSAQQNSTQRNGQDNTQDTIQDNNRQRPMAVADSEPGVNQSGRVAKPMNAGTLTADNSADFGLNDSADQFTTAALQTSTGTNTQTPTQTSTQMSTSAQTSIPKAQVRTPSARSGPDPASTGTTPTNALNTVVNAAATSTVLRFNFVENSWVEVLDENDQQLIYGMVEQGSIRELAISGPVKVFLGNIEGALITVNGAPYSVPSDVKVGRTARFVLAPGQSGT